MNISTLNELYKEAYKDYNWNLLFGPFKMEVNKLFYKESFYFLNPPPEVKYKKTLILELE